MSVEKALQGYWDAAPEIAAKLAKAEAQAKSENDALRKDAERYRWVRDHCYIELRCDSPRIGWSKDALDSAVDAAMAKAAP